MLIKLTSKLARELRTAFRNNKFEQTESGILFAGSNIEAAGMWSVQKNDEAVEYSKNLITTEGLNHMLDVTLRGTSANATWYVAPFSGNVTVLNTWTAANFTANATENTGYDEAARVAFVEAAASGGSITNSASKAVFTFNATATVYGAGLLSASAKSSTSGVLFAAVRFASSKSVVDDDVINVGYTVTLTSS
jgi:hypothetical protein